MREDGKNKVSVDEEGRFRCKEAAKNVLAGIGALSTIVVVVGGVFGAFGNFAIFSEWWDADERKQEQMLDDYDESVIETVRRVGIVVDELFIRMRETPQELRTYENFAESYTGLEVALRDFLLREESRPIARYSTEWLCELAIEVRMMRDLHREDGIVSNNVVGGRHQQFATAIQTAATRINSRGGRQIEGDRGQYYRYVRGNCDELEPPFEDE